MIEYTGDSTLEGLTEFLIKNNSDEEEEEGAEEGAKKDEL